MNTELYTFPSQRRNRPCPGVYRAYFHCLCFRKGPRGTGGNTYPYPGAGQSEYSEKRYGRGHPWN